MELKTGKKLRTGAVIVAAGHKSKNSVFKPLLPVGDSTAIRRIIITLKRAENHHHARGELNGHVARGDDDAHTPTPSTNAGSRAPAPDAAAAGGPTR